jgi:tetratricopeptide (TPR) repeat protein
MGYDGGMVPAASIPQAPGQIRPSLAKVPYPVYLLGAAILAAAITVVFFCPAYSVWFGMFEPGGAMFPETNRAADTLRQLHDPFVKSLSPSNRVIEWRLFFPLLGYYLRLHPVVFLALPHVGCLAALALVIHIACRELGDRLWAFCTGVVAASCAWFFVSTSWLTYNDSWIVLGLLAVSAIRSRYVLVFAALCCPWIDERFVMLLPVCLGLRTYLFHDYRFPRDLVGDAAVALAGVSPYVLIRLAAMLSGSDAALKAMEQSEYIWPTPLRLLEGAWAGLRGLWLYAAAFWWLAYRIRPLVWNLIFSVGTALVFTVSCFIAADIGRSVSVFLPVGLVGLVLLHRSYPQWCIRSLPCVMVLNLVLPAAHVMSTFKWPIRNLYGEQNRPLPDAEEFNRRGEVMMQEKEAHAEAFKAFTIALDLDPAHIKARLNRAALLLLHGETDSALAEVNMVIERRQDLAPAHYLRGVCWEALGNAAAAMNDYEQALRLAPPDWERREDTRLRLQRLRAVEEKRNQ